MKKLNRVSLFAVVVFALIGLSACTSVKKDLGIARNSPDEFSVIKRAPLSVPPEYNLVPPVSKADKSEVVEEQSAEETARQSLMGSAAPAADEAESDKVFLAKLKTDSAKENVRNLIDEENGYILIQNQSVLDKLTSSSDEINPDKFPASEVNAPEEAKRIKQNQDESKPLNEGVVPVIEKKKSTLDKIF